MTGAKLTVISNIKGYLKKEHNLQASADLEKAIDDKIIEILDKAAIRAKGNFRSTIMVRDL